MRCWPKAWSRPDHTVAVTRAVHGRGHPLRSGRGYQVAPDWPYLRYMGRLILGIVGLVAAFIVIMLVLAVVHVLFLYAFFIALIAIAAFTMFKVGRWTGRRRGRES
jgi:hypothetical protein